MTPDDDLERWAERVADGAAIDTHDLGASRSERNLAELARLSQFFSGGFRDKPIEPGAQWCGLTIVEQIGEGGFGRVYRARDEALGRDVALKILRRAGIDADRFIAEARRMARVRNPHVLKVHGVDQVGDDIGIWTELVIGRTLSDLVQAGAQSGRELDLMIALTDAVSAVHQCGLVHGDIKASNVMLDVNDNLVLMDFGAAEWVQARARPTAGSPFYMADELVRGGEMTPASDVFALGVIFFQLLGDGQKPYSGDPADVDGRRIEWDRLGATEARLKSLIQAMLAADPSQRPSSGELLGHLNAARMAPQLRFRRRMQMALVAVLTVALGIALIGAYVIRAARDEAVAEAQRANDAVQSLGQLLAASRPTRQGRNVTMLEALDDYVANLDHVLPGQPRSQVFVLTVIARSYQQLGEQDRALEVADRALAVADRRQDLVSWFGIGVVRAATLIRQTRLDEAQAALDELAPFAEGIEPSHVDWRAEYHRQRANLALDRNELGAATRILERLQAMPLSPRDAILADIVRINIAQQSGDALGAARAAEQALTQSLEHNGERHVNTIVARSQLAEALVALGRHDEALPHVQTNLRTLADWLGPAGRDYEVQQNLLGLIYRAQGEFKQALAVYDALLAAEQLGAIDRATLLINRANTLKDLGRLTEAIEQYREARRVAAAINPRSMNVILAGNNLAEALVDAGEYDAAHRAASAALALDTELLGANHPFVSHARMMLGAAAARVESAEQGFALLQQAADELAASVGVDSELYWQARALAYPILIEFERVQEAAALRLELAAQRSKLPDNHLVAKLLSQP